MLEHPLLDLLLVQEDTLGVVVGRPQVAEVPETVLCTHGLLPPRHPLVLDLLGIEIIHVRRLSDTSGLLEKHVLVILELLQGDLDEILALEVQLQVLNGLKGGLQARLVSGLQRLRALLLDADLLAHIFEKVGGGYHGRSRVRDALALGIRNSRLQGLAVTLHDASLAVHFDLDGLHGSGKALLDGVERGELVALHFCGLDLRAFKAKLNDHVERLVHEG
mmetsp:Transcript_16902/g.34396  ORF Transcript_16902/g.34396 Transcript_16902/m.34396 type:complete len:220 (+) Transcript_16902:138-797(+)